MVHLDLQHKGLVLTVRLASRYVDLVAQHRMTTAIKEQINAFLGGFWELIPKVRPGPCDACVRLWLLSADPSVMLALLLAAVHIIACMPRG